jgi:hypothetical protein
LFFGTESLVASLGSVMQWVGAGLFHEFRLLFLGFLAGLSVLFFGLKQ